MKFTIRSTVLAILSILVIAIKDVANGEELRTASCTIVSGSGNGTASGTIQLSQKKDGGEVTIHIKLNGLSSAGKHGFHIHANSSLGNKCMEAASHLNVDNTLHGAPNDPKEKRHTGDLGNVMADSSGAVDITMTDWLISLDGPNSVIGKPIVVHSGEDDLGRGGAPTSNTTGNAGGRIGCCLIKEGSDISAPIKDGTGDASSIRATLSTFFIACNSSFILRALFGI